MNSIFRGILILVFSITFSAFVKGQISGTILGQDTTRNIITTSVPFLSIAPDPRSGAMGDVGAATSPNANTIHWNPAKLAFINKDIGFSLSYTPWLGKIIDDMSISYLSGFKKIDDIQAIGIALTYFDLGDILLNDGPNPINQLGSFNPREFAIATTYSRKLSDALSIGVTGKFIHSNLTGNITSNPNVDSKPGTSIAADLGVYYYNSNLTLTGKNAELAFGAIISNIGSKISYNSADEEDFIPTNLRLGSSLTTHLDPYNKITVALDFNKLLVPTPQPDGSERDKSLISGIFGSFGDAPGGFSEELKEIMIAFGTEYWYDETFALRAGYFHQNQDKGGARYFTMGVGFVYKKLGFDFAYLVPQVQNHPLAETLRFGLHFSLDKKEE